MSGGVFAIVILAAVLHAVWNALVKSGTDKTAAMTAIVLGQGVAGAIALPFAQVPDPKCWPWFVASLGLHFGYQMFLIAAYRIGDLTQVYPIARGVSPLLVAGASILFLGETLSVQQGLGVILIAFGIASISLVRRGDGLFQAKAAGLAVITGGFIAAYSLVDGVGARIAGTALGFYAWLAVAGAFWFLGVSPMIRRGVVRDALTLRTAMIVGGGASFVAYALVVYAFTLAPIALVTALRETSIIFALLIGIVVLKERISLAKVVATLMTLIGAALLRMARGG
ncbi:MAG: EamA family transporter [Pseudooceanicola sp.]